MASFLKAEELSGQPTMTESQIEDTLERSRQRQHAHSMLRRPSQKGLSVLFLVSLFKCICSRCKVGPNSGP